MCDCDGNYWNLRLDTADVGRLPEAIVRRIATPRVTAGTLLYCGIPAQSLPEDILPALREHGITGAYQRCWTEARDWTLF